MKTIVIVLAVFVFFEANCQLEKHTEPLSSTEGWMYEGEILFAKTWKEKSGEDIFIVSQNSPYSESNRLQGTDVFFYRYQRTKNGIRILSKYKDGEKKCLKDFDLLLKVFTEDFKVTDLDNDGICEAWVVYKSLCTTDIRPANLRVLMIEGSDKYQMIGHSKVPHKPGTQLGGDKDFDVAFKKGPKVFRDYCMVMWKDFESRMDW